MKKSLTKSALSFFAFALVGLGLVALQRSDVILDALNNLLAIDFAKQWYIIIPPGVAVLLMVILLIVKIKRKERSYFIVFSLLLLSAAYLVVAPIAFNELLNSLANQVAPPILTFTTGAAFIVLMLLLTVIVGLIDLFVCGQKKVRRAVEEVDEDDDDEYEEDEEDDDDEYEEDEEDDLEPLTVEEGVEEEVEEEVEKPVKKAPVKKAVAKAPVKKAPAKEHDRIYHVMKRKKDDNWVVKIAQSPKAIKLFATQKEAIAFADELAENNNGVVRVFASKGAQKGKIIN